MTNFFLFFSCWHHVNKKCTINFLFSRFYQMDMTLKTKILPTDSLKKILCPHFTARKSWLNMKHEMWNRRNSLLHYRIQNAEYMRRRKPTGKFKTFERGNCESCDIDLMLSILKSNSIKADHAIDFFSFPLFTH